MSETALQPEIAQAAHPRPRHCQRPRLRATLAWLAVILVVGLAIGWGVQLRQWLWDSTEEIRFVNSVSNAIEWGRYANRVGVLKVYDELLERNGAEGDFVGEGRFALDYPPLRLRIAAWWADWAQRNFPPPPGQPLTWQRPVAFNRPMLELNLACELLASAGMFLLVYRWLRICKLSPPRKWWTLDVRTGWGRDEELEKLRALPSTVALFPATLAALLMWFSPAVLLNAHIYPQWDVWVVPAFVFAVYFGLRDWWLPAGLIVGITAMAKGQIMLALPVLVAWPLLLGNVGGAVRLLIGFAAGVGLTVWPWLLQGVEAKAWMQRIALGGALVVAASLLPLEVSVRLIAVLTLGGIIAGALLTRRRWIPTWIAAFWAAGLAFTILLCHASTAWYEVGIAYGARHWRFLFWCHAANLGSILQLRYRWGYTDTADLSWVPWLDLGPQPIRLIMIGLYVFTLALCILAVVRHRRNHDPRFLLAVCAPMMMAYTLLPQMVERYLLWPAALLSAFAAISVGGFFLWLVLSALACLLMLEYMVGFVPQTPFARDYLPSLSGLFPDVSWGILILAGIMLYLSVRSSRNVHRMPLEQ